MVSGWNLWVWLQCIGVVSGWCCKEVPYIGKFSLLKNFRCWHQPRKFNTRYFLTMNNYHGQHIVTRARACLIFVDGPDNEN